MSKRDKKYRISTFNAFVIGCFIGCLIRAVIFVTQLV